ncbi:hypothetical protein KKF34_15060 [Myxococcota bacterium]|nr:hypothetical protein [Myxococcota bacterium]MBU1379441.1 hypothetical protein [Myxococcota bacterium]MBU1498196.1 hypothetical protein [Myxococcota bacterium]
MKKFLNFALFVSLIAFYACDDGSENTNNTNEYTFMDGNTADCEFGTVSFLMGGQTVRVDINGLDVEVLSGADKIGAENVEIVTRRGVRFSAILDKAEITAPDDAPFNAIGRDGYDPLRTRLEGDTSKLPTFAFVRDNAYIYVGYPGDKDPLYPEMEGKTLMVDFDLEDDAEVPEYLGSALSAIGMFRWKMVEYINETTAGLFEINPEVE